MADQPRRNAGDTGNQAEPGDPGHAGLAAAREALAAARADAKARGVARPTMTPSAVPAEAVPDEAGRSRQSQSDRPVSSERPLRRIRREDPQPLGTAIEGLLDAEGWNLAAATGSVFGRWAEIVGPDLAGHTQPESLRDGELIVLADSTAWATQLRLLAAQLVHRLNAELGSGAVQRVKVSGPVTSRRRPGEWRVKGSRGPRDTYG